MKGAVVPAQPGGRAGIVRTEHIHMDARPRPLDFRSGTIASEVIPSLPTSEERGDRLGPLILAKVAEERGKQDDS